MEIIIEVKDAPTAVMPMDHTTTSTDVPGGELPYESMGTELIPED